MPDPDLEMWWWWGGGLFPPIFFSALWASIWSKMRRGGGLPLDPLLQSHEQNSNCNIALTMVPEGKRRQRLLGGTQFKKRERKRAGTK